jgi:site-specific DNA-cytosine methylase
MEAGDGVHCGGVYFGIDADVNVLVACEFSGIVRDAFLARGHSAISADLLPSERGQEHHLQGDLIGGAGGGIFGTIRRSLGDGWSPDLIIAFPPCTHLAVSGARWFKNKRVEQEAAVAFFMAMIHAPAKYVAVENPIGIMSTRYRKPDQIIQPWQFGHGETKATCLWLKGLPPLRPTKIVEGRTPRVHHASPGPDRWKERSRTLQGIADAMAAQWE